MSVLVVIDMQPGFEATRHNGVLDAVVAEVEQARSQGRPVIIVEYGGYGLTYDSIMRVLTDPLPYEHFVVLRKTRWSGADIALDYCLKQGWDTSKYRVCGVNTFECVAETAEEFTVLSPDSLVEVVKEACNDKVIGWKMFPKHPNIRLASQRNPLSMEAAAAVA